MVQKMIHKKNCEELSEEELILSNPDMRAAIEESLEAERKGVKPWKLKLHR